MRQIIKQLIQPIPKRFRKRFGIGLIVMLCLWLLLLVIKGVDYHRQQTAKHSEHHRSPVSATHHITAYPIKAATTAHIPTLTSVPTTDLSATLAAINTRLAQLEQHATGSTTKPIQVKLDAIATQLQTITQTWQTTLQQAVHATTTPLVTQLRALTHQVAMLNAEKTPKAVLPVSALPFRVAHIDYLAGQTIVTVNYAHLYTPLAVGDRLVGWQLIQANLTTQTATFVNAKGQRVVVDDRATKPKPHNLPSGRAA